MAIENIFWSEVAGVYCHIVLAETEWVLESLLACTREQTHSLIHTLASHTQFQFEDWAALNNALLDYIEFSQVDLSDCLIARCAQNAGASTLFTFENEKSWGLCPWWRP